MRIYKYEFSHNNTLHLPLEAKILDIQEQHGKIVAWATVDENQEEMDLAAVIVLTGQNLDTAITDNALYLKTMQFAGRNYVIHIFVFKNFM